MKWKFLLLALLLILQSSYAVTMLETVRLAFSQLCLSVKSLLPVVAMMMLIVGGVIYAGGQIMGAETRARANVWATACLTGALIAVLIVVVVQPVLQMIYPDAPIACE